MGSAMYFVPKIGRKEWNSRCFFVHLSLIKLMYGYERR